MYWFHEIVGKVHVTDEDVHAVVEAGESMPVPVYGMFITSMP